MTDDIAYEVPIRDRIASVASELEDGWRASSEPRDRHATRLWGDEVSREVGRILRAHLDDLDRQVGEVVVKPLEWEEVTSPREDGPPEPIGVTEATSVVGEASIHILPVPEDDTAGAYAYSAWLTDDFLGQYHSEEAAQAAVQAEVQRRIRSALAPSPAIGRETDFAQAYAAHEGIPAAELAATVARYGKALQDALIWHEEQDKALSKQPPSHGPNGTQWARLQHREQIDAIKAALGAQP